MPNKKNAVKALRQSKKKQLRNDKTRLSMHDIKRKVRKSIESETSVEDLQKLYKDAQVIFDKAVKNNIIKKNSASRKKASIAKMINKKNSVKSTDAKVEIKPKKTATKKATAKKVATKKATAKKVATKKATAKKVATKK